MQRGKVAPNNPLTSLQIQPSIPEELELEMSESELFNEIFTVIPNNLFNNPTHNHSDKESNNQASDKESIYSTTQSQTGGCIFSWRWLILILPYWGIVVVVSTIPDVVSIYSLLVFSILQSNFSI